MPCTAQNSYKYSFYTVFEIGTFIKAQEYQKCGKGTMTKALFCELGQNIVLGLASRYVDPCTPCMCSWLFIFLRYTVFQKEEI